MATRESLMWRWDGRRLSWLICFPELRDHYAATGGWRPLGTLGGSDTEQIEAVRQAEQQRWTPEVRRKTRWQNRRKRLRLGGAD